MKKAPQTEAEYLKHYNPKDYDTPLVTVDLGIFTLHEGELKVLLVQRGDYPEKGKWALPGGFVDVHRDASPEATAMRKLQEKTGVKSPYLEQLGTFGGAKRDPRGWSLTVVYFALIPYTLPKIKSAPGNADSTASTSKVDSINSEANSVEKIAWVEVNEALRKKFAFDHSMLLARALERIRSKVLYTLMPAHLIDAPFTLTALQRAYETIMDREVEKKAFRRRLENAGVLEETGEMVGEGPGRPAMLYRLKPGIKTFSFSRQLAQ